MRMAGEVKSRYFAAYNFRGINSMSGFTHLSVMSLPMDDSSIVQSRRELKNSVEKLN
jgi:hypothetical protein